MRPSPYAMVAYSPASNTAAIRRSANRSTSLRAVRVWGGALRRGRVGRRDDRRGAIRHVLLDHERRVGLLTELGGEGQLAAREQRRHLQRHQLLADRVAIGGTGLLDHREEGARGLVAERLVPLGDLAG